MKILELRFKNLNSLYGEWHIDFTDPEYAYNGIFALTGPTGAGKSTILDAICLALYGSTPRLGRITQSSNDIMSRQTGECYAEVVFASQAGRYRCHWTHHRSRKKADGELQSPRHEISEADDEGKVIENKLTSVLSAVEEKTGMDFDRFTRSILLAQGGFDTFLKASVEQKSKILEQITGTKIYSDISVGVHERLRDEKNTLATLEAETRGIPILSPEEVSVLEERVKLAQQEEDSLTTLVTDLSKAIVWLNGIADLEREISDLNEEGEAISKALSAFEPNRSLLVQATKAATLEGVYATLEGLRTQQQTEITSLATEENALIAFDLAAQAGSEILSKAEGLTSQAKTLQKEAIPLIREVRSLDQNIAQMQRSIKESTHSITEDIKSIEAKKTERERETGRAVAEEKNLLLVDAYLSQHVQDKALISDLTGITEQIQALSSKQNTVAIKESEADKAAKASKDAAAALARCKIASGVFLEQHTLATKDLQDTKEELSQLLEGKLLREYRSEKDTLLREREYLARIAALEEHRKHLADGKACPLCGSLEHPFAIDKVPTPDETEERISFLSRLITDADDLETKIQGLIRSEQEAGAALTGQEKLESDALHAKKGAQTTHDVAQGNIIEAQEEFIRMKQRVIEKIAPYGINDIPGDLAGLLATLRARKDAWQKNEQATIRIENTIHSIRGELQALTGIIDTQELSLQGKRVALKALTDSFTLAIQDRQELYGDKDADEEEERIGAAVSAAEVAEKLATKSYTELVQKVSISKNKIETLRSAIEKRKPVLGAQESMFLHELSSLGFSDEQLFLSARLTVQERNSLLLEAKTLDERQIDLKGRYKDRITRLSEEQAKKITDAPLGALQSLLVEYETNLKGVRETVAEGKARIKGNVEAKKSIEEKQEAIGNQRKECAKWEKLHSLIGSSDGKKFRNFAQGLTFELMVSHANRQLAKMSERYLLIRSEEQPLELNVIDNYQAGEIRSTKNLSGGESFIVSLTLALGLSQMASKKVRVDSLFLDEGFGTLDEESLETALKTLSALQQDGKLIGVISHVPAMQEMISTQITIAPVSGGKSVLSGPGCSRVG